MRRARRVCDDRCLGVFPTSPGSSEEALGPFDSDAHRIPVTMLLMGETRFFQVQMSDKHC